MFRRHASTKFPDNKTVEQGAATSVYAALAPGVIGGRFYNDCAEAEAAAYATDPAAAERLWELSEELLAAAPN